MKSINIFLFGSTLCHLRKQLRPKTGKRFIIFSLFILISYFLFMKCINILCLRARCVSSWISFSLKQGIPWNFVFLLFLYKLSQWGYVKNIVLYHKHIKKLISIWHTVVGIYGSGVCGFVVCVVGLWGCRQALNRLKINILFWRKMIWTMRKPWSGLGQLITLIGYSSGLPDISESRRPLPVSAPTYLCLDKPVSGLRAHQQTQSQWYQRFEHFT